MVLFLQVAITPAAYNPATGWGQIPAHLSTAWKVTGAGQSRAVLNNALPIHDKWVGRAGAVVVLDKEGSIQGSYLAVASNKATVLTIKPESIWTDWKHPEVSSQ